MNLFSSKIEFNVKRAIFMHRGATPQKGGAWRFNTKIDLMRFVAPAYFHDSWCHAPKGGAWRLNLKITGVLLGGFLFLGASSGQALVSLQHYEKMKMQNKQKTKEPEKVQQQVPVKIQVHQQGQGGPAAGKAGQK